MRIETTRWPLTSIIVGIFLALMIWDSLHMVGSPHLCGVWEPHEVAGGCLVVLLLLFCGWMARGDWTIHLDNESPRGTEAP